MKKTAEQFLSETKVNHICTCQHRDTQTYCPEKCLRNVQDLPCTCGKVSFCPADCENRLPDRNELIDRLEQEIEIWGSAETDGAKFILKFYRDLLSYISATPIKVVDGTGRVFCTCANQHADLSHYPEIAQAQMDADTEAQLIPMPSVEQWKYFGYLFQKASFAQRKKVIELVPNPKKFMSKLIEILKRK